MNEFLLTAGRKEPPSKFQVDRPKAKYCYSNGLASSRSGRHTEGGDGPPLKSVAEITAAPGSARSEQIEFDVELIAFGIAIDEKAVGGIGENELLLDAASQHGAETPVWWSVKD